MGRVGKYSSFPTLELELPKGKPHFDVSSERVGYCRTGGSPEVYRKVCVCEPPLFREIMASSQIFTFDGGVNSQVEG